MFDGTLRKGWQLATKIKRGWQLGCSPLVYAQEIAHNKYHLMDSVLLIYIRLIYHYDVNSIRYVII